MGSVKAKFNAVETLQLFEREVENTEQTLSDLLNYLREPTTTAGIVG